MADEKFSYFDKLSFNLEWKKGILYRYLTNIRIVFLFVLLIVVVGVASYFSLPRRLNPDISIPIVSVITVLPGAGPESVETLLTVPIEDAVKGLRGVSQVSSSSRENLAAVTIEFESGTDGERARQDVQSAVNGITGLPDDSQDPRVALFDFEDQPVWQFAVVAPSGEEASLMRFADELERVLGSVSSIDRVSVSGSENREISVRIDLQKVYSLGLNPQSLSGSVRDALAAYPAGNVSSDGLLFPVSIDESVRTVEDIRTLPINVDGNVLLLGDISVIQDAAQSGQAYAYYAVPGKEPLRAVTLSVFRSSTANIDKAVNDARAEVNRVEALYKNGFEIVDVVDTSKEIDDQFNDLVSNFWQTMLLVALVLFLFLGIRQSLVAAFAIPLVFLITFIVMNVSGITLNFLSLFSLLLSLGLLVDAAIVVITAVTDYYKSGKFSAEESGRLVFADFFLAILTTTLTTVWAFLPLLLASGIIGEFIKSIPIVVSTTLLASMVVGLFINLPLMMFLLNFQIARRVKIVFWTLFYLGLVVIAYNVFSWNPNVIPIVTVIILILMVIRYVIRKYKVVLQGNKFKNSTKGVGKIINEGVVSVDIVSSRYARILERILVKKSSRWLTILMVVLLSIFSYALVPFGFVKNEFFPGESGQTLYVNVRLPVGTQIAETNVIARDLVRELSSKSSVKSVVVEPGRSISLGGGGGSSGGGTHTILATLNLNDKSSQQLSGELRDFYRNYALGEVQVVEISGGPPAGSDVQIKLFGDDLNELTSYANQLKSKLGEEEGLNTVDLSVEPSVARVVFVPNDLELARLQITRRDIGFWFRTLVSGFTLDDLRVGSEEKDITLRLGQGVPSIESLQTIMIPTRQGNVPITQLGEFRLDYNPTVITREDGKRTISVLGDVLEGFSVSDTNAKLLNFAEELQLPTGYFFETGGVNEENARSVNSILQAMGLSAFLIFATMVLQFGSFRKAILVLLVIPPAISGVFIVFAITGTPLSFPALIGVLALFGIVVNNSIIVIEKIGQNLGVGMTLVDSLVDAGRARLEPIFFSSLTTIIGLIPITMSNPLWQGLGGAVIAGLVFSGTIMLFFIPVVYYMWFAPRD